MTFLVFKREPEAQGPYRNLKGLPEAQGPHKIPQGYIKVQNRKYILCFSQREPKAQGPHKKPQGFTHIQNSKLPTKYHTFLDTVLLFKFNYESLN